MCPSQAKRRALIHLTRSNVRHLLEASWWGVLPEIILTIWALAPFSFLIVASLRDQASEPYVMMLHTDNLYSRSQVEVEVLVLPQVVELAKSGAGHCDPRADVFVLASASFHDRA